MGNTTATPNTPQTTEQTQLLWENQKNTLDATASARIEELEEQLKWERFRANTFQQILISACSNNQETAERYGVVPGYPAEELKTYWAAVDKAFHERKHEILANSRKTQ